MESLTPKPRQNNNEKPNIIVSQNPTKIRIYINKDGDDVDSPDPRTAMIIKKKSF